MGKFHTALEKANAALDFATEAGLDIYKPKIYESLHSIHDSLGNTALAYQYFQTYAQLKDSMFNSKVYFSAQELADQEALQDAKAVYSEKMAALNQSKQRVILLSVGTVLAALLLLIGVWRYYKNKEGATLRFLLSRLTAIGKAPSKQGNTSAPQPSLLGTGRMEELMTELQRLQVAVHNLGNTTPSPKEEAQLSQIVKEKMEYLEGLQFSISHDLKRYVLNLQNQLSGLVSRNQPLSPSEVAPVQKITEEMIQFMEQLKEIHRIDELSIQTTFINLQDLVKDILQQLSPEQNYPEVQIDFSSALPTVETDPLLARQVITNLLENALKYSQHSTQPKVEIGLIDKAPQTVLYIRDNGAGIPEEDQSRIFEPFFRSNHTKTEGTGLGLAISRIAAQKLGGELRLESKLGKGSTFYFAISA
jgi:signal transduction histidine kinase